MTTTLRPAIGYVRVGSASPGLASKMQNKMQKQRIEEWAAETGHEIVRWVEEYGVGHASGTFDTAVSGCRGKLIVAVDAARISRHLPLLREQLGRVRAAGGRLGFVEGWQEEDVMSDTAIELLTIMAAHDEARVQGLRAAGAWDPAERPGYDED